MPCDVGVSSFSSVTFPFPSGGQGPIEPGVVGVSFRFVSFHSFVNLADDAIRRGRMW